jgi:alpha-D-ribose 1-methylphosphonate 5-triphosphate synthase subunit PhnI
VPELSSGGKMSKDEYYASTAARLDTIIGGDTTHFLRLQRAKAEYDALAHDVPVGQGFLTFYDYVKEYYGVKLVMDGDNLSLEYAVIDEKKYTVFLLKFNK